MVGMLRMHQYPGGGGGGEEAVFEAKFICTMDGSSAV